MIGIIFRWITKSKIYKFKHVTKKALTSQGFKIIIEINLSLHITCFEKQYTDSRAPVQQKSY